MLLQFPGLITFSLSNLADGRFIVAMDGGNGDNFMCTIRQRVDRVAVGVEEKAEAFLAEVGAGYEESGQRNPVERMCC